MEKILGLIKENKKTAIAIIIAILGYFGYDDIAKQVEEFTGEPTEVVADSTDVAVDSAAVVIDTTSAE